MKATVIALAVVSMVISGFCTLCPEGHYCDPITLGDNGECFDNTFSFNDSFYCLQPPPGYVALANHTNFTNCSVPNNFSNPFVGQDCALCPAGFDCTNNTDLKMCSDGYYSEAGNGTCYECPAGMYCSEKGPPQSCAGTAQGNNEQFCEEPFTKFTLGYRNVSGVQTPCQAGYFCPDPHNSVEEPCPDGYYSEASWGYCQPCPPGSSCNSTAATPCNSPSEMGLNGTCYPCPAGYSCADPALIVRCEEGSISVGGLCVNCSVGSYCPSVDSVQLPCPIGYHSELDSTHCSPCPGGMECTNNSGLGSACTTGYYALPLVNSSECTQCPEGSYCPFTDGPPIPCAEGTYSAAEWTECLGCPQDIMCEDGKNSTNKSCSPGYYSLGYQSNCTKCKDGYSCPGPSAPVRCLPGTYSSVDGVTCENCEAGYACPTGHRRNKHECPNGTYSLAQSSICTPHINGVITEDVNGTNLTTCSPGQYVNSTYCEDCPLGYFCPDFYHDPYECMNGTYTNVTNQMNCTVCSAGYQCFFKTEQIECDNGSYALPASMNCTKCLQGHYCPAKDRPLVKECEVGFYAHDEGQESCDPCPVNHECLDKINATACNSSYYSLEGWGECVLCPAGQSCEVIPPVNCNAGHYSKEGQASCSDCPAGHYCVEGASMPTQCPAGAYQGSTAQGSCDDCTSGQYSARAATACTNCPAGYKCPEPYMLPMICEMGSYSAGSSTSCSQCDDGYVCYPGETMSNPTDGKCPRGYYCSITVVEVGVFRTEIDPCPAGTYGNAEGASLVTHCPACTAGHFCPLTGMSTPLPCSRGCYCAGSNTYSTKCSAGSYNPKRGSSSSGDCITCPSGNYCPEGAIEPIPCLPGAYCAEGSGSTSGQCPIGTYSTLRPIYHADNCTACPMGAYCELGTGRPTLCPPGTFNPSTNQATDAACTNCSAGYACPQYGHINDSGIPCPPGYYCISGTSFAYEHPCPAGSYSNEHMAGSDSVCFTCPQGWVCTEATNNFTNPMQRCSPGYYCPDGTDRYDRYPCAGGKYQPYYGATKVEDCLYDCPPGQYCTAGSAHPLGNCEIGYYCPAGSSSSRQNPCPAGTYGNQQALKSAEECIQCEQGHYCAAGSTNETIQRCPPGTYNPSTGKSNITDCVDCEEGYYCPGEANTYMRECGYGYYSGSKSSGCTLCMETFYCNTTHHPMSSILNNVTTCEAGYICPHGVGEYPNATLLCPAGYYCSPRAVDPTPCPPGTYNPKSGGMTIGDCLNTPAGYYSTRGSARPTGECAPGFYCPQNSIRASMTPCSEGTFRSSTNGASQSDCGPCPAGYFCLVGTSIPTPCPRGFFCEPSLKLPVKCSSGYFGASPMLRQNEQCTKCWSGRFCSVQGLTMPDGSCDPGFYCEEGAIVPNPTDGTTGNLCPAGGVCPAGSKAPQPCEPGYYSDTTGMKSTSECSACTAGNYCLGEVKNGVSGPCLAGYYCPPQSKTEKEKHATPGHYTSGGASSESNCNIGSYTPNNATVTCTPSPAGYYIPDAGNKGVFLDCPEGKYCGLGTSTPSACPAGTYSPIKNLHASSECSSCPPGKYCTGGLSAPDGDCDSGFYCVGGMSVSNPVGYECPKGHYCTTGTSKPTPCPVGKYNSATGSTSDVCISCDQGYYCDRTGMAAAENQCDKGYYCPGGQTSPRPSEYRCDVGQKCPAGSHAPDPCPAGTYQDSVAQGDCMACPRGFYCTQGMSTFIGHDCPAGYFCPESTTSSTQHPCPLGTYNSYINAFHEDQCVGCDPGHYCPTTHMTTVGPACNAGYYCVRNASASAPNDATGKQCTAGYYCPSGTSHPIPCPPGKACTTAGLSGDEGNCSAGYYCILSATSKTPASLAQGGGPCLVGHYCPSGSAEPIPCPMGTFSNNAMNTQLDDCEKCTDGYYCDEPARTTVKGMCAAGYACKKDVTMIIGFTVAKPVEKICQKGYYCPEGTPAMVPCSATEYQDNEGQSHCKACPAGYYCTAIAKFKCIPNLEKVSYYCPDNVRENITCGDGKYAMQEYASTLSDCLLCPKGKYCPQNPSASQDKLNTCPAGRYCAEGSGSTMGSLCEAGYYCPSGIADHKPCPPGKYCETTGLTDADLPARDCAGGYWCIEGSATSTPTDGTKGKKCPAGHYCPSGTKAPQACPPGTFRSSVQGVSLADCQNCSEARNCSDRGRTSEGVFCPAGYYCPEATAAGKEYPCEPGYKCPTGSASMTLCPNNTYQPIGVQADCISCPERFYCLNFDANDAKTPKICPQGQYCTGGSQPANCAAGTYNPREGIKSQAECEPCPPGKMCLTAGLITYSQDCIEGYYCVRGVGVNPPPGGITGGICPKGFYCPTGTIAPVPCPPGTVNNFEGKIKLEDCVGCSPRYYCPYRGGTDEMYFIGVNESFYCAEGHICYGNATMKHPTDGVTGKRCGVGKFCMAGATQEENCTLFHYNPYEGQGSCTNCPGGRYCEEIGMSTYHDCPTGHYCPEGQDKTICPAGTYNPTTNLEFASQCYPCDPGKYCIGGKDQPDTACDPGYVCPRGAAHATSSAIFSWTSPQQEGLCPPGSYCLSESTAPIPCPVGEYQDEVGKTNCTSCPVGRYCPVTNISDPSVYLCGAGHYCTGGATKKFPMSALEGGKLCTEGYFCPEGTLYEVGCPNGTYEPRTGSSECQECPAGFYCINNATAAIDCPANKYCPNRTGIPITCPDGTYSNTAGLQKVENCRPCTTGRYCQDGLVKGHCNAGYYCEFGAAIPNNSSMECPIGHYCLAGTQTPTVCPEGKVRWTTGAANATDCYDCPAGSYCIPSVATPYDCPQGHYCPAGSQSPIPCPAGQYNNFVSQDEPTDCVLCQPGFNCTTTGIGNLTHFACPSGYFCANSSLDPEPCPKGTFNNITGLASTVECQPCPEGFTCQEKTVSPTICQEGRYCAIGSYQEQNCPKGYYCRYITEDGITISRARLCPGGYYCPVNTINPLKCTNGYYCPTGSGEPTPCPSGAMGSKNEYNDAIDTGCLICPPGSYSVKQDDDPTSCLPCVPGYVCVYNTSKVYPVDPNKDGGYQCPKGYYCPEGSYKPTPCAKGFFNKAKLMPNSSYCYKCETNSYGDLEGQGGCKPCGPTSTSDPGSTTCKCIGKHRVFQKSNGKCVCKQYYTSVLDGDKDDSKYDCRPLLLEQCSSGHLRNTFGQCVPDDDCSAACPGGKGKITPGLGVCECSTIQDVDQVCNATCRNATMKLTINSNGQFVFPNGTVIDMRNVTSAAGEPSCISGDCKVVSLSLTSGTGFSSNYQPSTNILNLYKQQRRLTDESVRRLLGSTSGSITNPAICISSGDTVTFDISPTKYPVYLKDAMANSNPEFDYSEFLNLDSRIKNGETPTTFIYTFHDPGVYVLGDSSDLNQQTVIAVMDTTEKCPSTDKYITPITASNLLNIGVKHNEDVTLEPDWIFIGCCFIVVLIVIPGVIVLIAYLHNRAWEAKTLAAISFGKPAEKKPISAEDARKNEVGQAKQTTEQAMISDRHVIEMERKDQQEGEIDPSIFDEIYKQLKEHSDYVRSEFNKKTRQDSVNIDNVWKRMKELREFMKEKLKKLAKIFGKNIKYMLSKRKKDERMLSEGPRESDLSLKELIEEDADEDEDIEGDKEILKQALENQLINDAQELEKLKEESKDKNKDVLERFVDIQNRRLEEFRDRILENSRLTEGDKQMLWKEYEKQLQDLHNQLLLSQAEQQNQLKMRIDARRAKREQLVAEKDRLNRSKDQVKKEIGNELDNLNKKAESEEQKIDEECNTELKQEEEQFEKRNKDDFEKLRTKFDSLLKRTSDPQSRSEILENYEKASQELEQIYKRERESTMNNLKNEIEKRRRRKKERLDQEVKEQRDSKIDICQHRLEQIREEENVIYNKLANVAIEEKVNEARESNQVKAKEEEEMLEQLKERKDEQLKKLDEEERERVEQLRKEFQNDEEAMRVENDRRKIITTTQTRKSCEDLNEQRKKLLREMSASGVSEDRKAQLQQELHRIEDQIKKRVEEELKKQDEGFSIKLQERRRLRAAKEAKLRQDAAEARATTEEKLQGEESKTKKQIREERFRRTLEELKSRMSNEELPIAVEKLLEEKHMEELSDLLAEQYQEKAKDMSKCMTDLIESKLVEVHQVKEDMEKEYSALKDVCDSQGLPTAEYERRLREMQEREHDQTRDIELAYIEKGNLIEHGLTEKLSAKNQKELMQLREDQLHEKHAVLNELAQTNQYARRLLSGDQMSVMASELEAYRRQLDEERDRKIKELESRKQRLQQIAVENESSLKLFNEETNRMMDELNKREREKLEKKRREIEEEKKRHERELKMKSGVSEAEREKMITDYNQELSALMSAMEEEHKRQSDLMLKKLEERWSEKEKLKNQKQLQLFMYRKERDDSVASQIKSMQIGFSKKVEVKDTRSKLEALLEKSDRSKMIFFKKKLVMGVEIAEEVKQAVQERVDLEKKEDEDEFEGTLINIDFSKILEPILAMEKVLVAFTNEKPGEEPEEAKEKEEKEEKEVKSRRETRRMDQRRENFMELMRRFKIFSEKLTDVKKHAIARKKR